MTDPVHPDHPAGSTPMLHVADLDIKVLALEFRALSAETRAALAENRAAIAELNTRISTLIDSIADVSRRFTGHYHPIEDESDEEDTEEGTVTPPDN
jgi:hypothetical protein